MAARVMFVQLKTGYNTDRGPAWISLVDFPKSWSTGYWHGRTLRRGRGLPDANFRDVATREQFWLSGPHRDRRDTRYSNVRPTIDDDVREIYAAFLDGADWPAHLSKQAGRAVRVGAAKAD